MCNVFVYSIYCTLLVACFSIYLIGVMLILVSAPANKKVHSYTLAERYLRFFYANYSQFIVQIPSKLSLQSAQRCKNA